MVKIKVNNKKSNKKKQLMIKMMRRKGGYLWNRNKLRISNQYIVYLRNKAEDAT